MVSVRDLPQFSGANKLLSAADVGGAVEGRMKPASVGSEVATETHKVSSLQSFLALTAEVEELNRQLVSRGRKVSIELDNDSGVLIVTVKDPVSNDVVLQVPSEESLRLSERIRAMSGLFIDRHE